MPRDDYARCMIPYKTLARTVCSAAGLLIAPKLGAPAGLAAAGACQAYVYKRGNDKCLPRR